jgi:AraC-like DNA-binding protein
VSLTGVSLIEAAVRGGAFFLLIVGAVIMLRDARRVPAAFFAALFGFGVACYTIVSASFAADQPPLLLLPLQIMAMGNPVVFCLFAAAVSDDDFKPTRFQALPWLAVVALGVFWLWSHNPAARIACSAVGLTCNAIGVWYALAGRSFDLVEERRRLRAALVIVVALYSAVMIVTDFAFARNVGPALALASGAGLLVITMVFVFLLLSVNRDSALISLGQSEPGMLAATPRRVAVATSFEAPQESDDDARLLAALRRLMEHDKAYREEGLSIGGLAVRLGTSEHGLRRLINQRLGYRNFNVFLNEHRIAEAKAALADPSQAEVPVITIAMDAGFQSLGPFNRAFKATTGVTPSEYRRLNVTVA